jgi:NodT family efflux transporter outer membrane factor (OMF) lipoprotein
VIRFFRSRGATAILLSATMLSACAVGPNYVAPAPRPDTRGAFVERSTSNMLSSAPLPADWWRMFQDPVLDRLIADAFAYNTDVRQAAANLRKARGVVSEERAGLLPTTQISGSYKRERIGADSVSSGSGSVPGSATGGPSHFDLNYYQAGFDASYEVDLFGRVSRSIEAARGDAQAAAAALDGARISIAAQVAQSYADACGYAGRANVARETVRLQTGTQQLTQRLLKAGRGTQRDVDQATLLLEQANAQLPALAAEQRAQLYALAVLTGRPPAEADAAAAACDVVPKVRTVIPVGDGATLLARRPDVRQAERTLAADTARIGIATAALFPSVNLLGSASLGSSKASHIGESRSFSFSFGPLISWNFPNIAVASAQIREARAGAAGSLAAFQGTILTALKETEQALARYAAALDQNAALGRATTAADDAARLSRLRYDGGRDNFLDVLVAEQNRADARQALAQSNAAVADAQISLFKALGGGWENSPPVATAATRAAVPADGAAH